MQGKEESNNEAIFGTHSLIHNHLLVCFFDFTTPLVRLLVLTAVALERVDI